MAASKDTTPEVTGTLTRTVNDAGVLTLAFETTGAVKAVFIQAMNGDDVKYEMLMDANSGQIIGADPADVYRLRIDPEHGASIFTEAK